MVERFDLSEDELAALLLDWNREANTPPLTDRDVRKCLRSARERTAYSPALAGGGRGRPEARPAGRKARPGHQDAPQRPARPLPDPEALAALRAALTDPDGPRVAANARDYLRRCGIDPAACGWGLARLTAEEAAEHGLPREAAGYRLLVPVFDPLTGELADVRRYAAGPLGEGVADGMKLLPWAKGHGSARPYRHGPDTAGAPVVWCEGEKDCEALRAAGIPAVSNTCGAGSARKVAEELAEELLPAEVTILFDADDAGRAGAEKLAAALAGRAVPVKIATWPPDVPAGFDVADAVAEGWTPAELQALLDAAEPYTPEEVDVIPAERPRIVVTGLYFEEKIDEARAAVEAANEPADLFLRSGELVEVSGDEHGWPIIRPVCVDSLRDRMARAAGWVKLIRSGRGDEADRANVPTDPPKDVVASALARPDKWRVPALEAVTQVPTLRPDGSLLLTPGYDAPTKLFYSPPHTLRLPAVPDSPTQQEAAEALARVWRIFEQFPFVDPDADRAGMLALLLTPIVRAAIVGPVPLCLIDAPQQGTGKSLLAEVVSIVATGQATFASSPRKGEEPEWRKLLTTLLTAGNTIIGFDNVDDVLRSAELARAITAPVWQDRMLGGNEQTRVPVRATFIATGNNLRVGGDLARRCYRVRIDARTAEPWERKGFAIPNLRGYALEHRGELLADLLTVARAWYAAGQPDAPGLPQLGSFEEWRRIIGGILAFAGVRGFLANLRELYEEADPDAAAWRVFLEAWREFYGDRAVTTKQLADVIDDAIRGAEQGSLDEADQALREALAEALPEFLRQPDGRVNRRSMGKQFDKVLGRRYPPDNIRLDRAGQDSHTCRWQWHVVADDPADQNAASSNPLPEPVSEGSAAFAAFSQDNAIAEKHEPIFKHTGELEQTRQTPQGVGEPALQADLGCRVSNSANPDDDDPWHWAEEEEDPHA
ncbi:MAG: hypothetical protein AMXMBFR83_25220 [Phycisphaerae bacterium]